MGRADALRSPWDSGFHWRATLQHNAPAVFSAARRLKRAWQFRGTTHLGDRKVFVFCPDTNYPYGGIRVLYRYVDVLNGLSVPATILHSSPNFRCTWFANTTPVISTQEFMPSPNDIVVLPENHGPGLASLFPGVPKVIFNQGCYQTFSGYRWDTVLPVNPYRHREVLGAMTVSADAIRYLEFAFPELKVARIHLSIDPDLYSPRDEKRPRICFMPRRNLEEATQVLQILRARGALEGIEVIPIDGVSEDRAAELMRSSLVFLSLGHPEGFGLPPAEAMACGCIVVGYHGMGGREYFDPAFCYPIEVHDIVAFASTVEHVLDSWRSDPASLSRMGRAAAHHILSTYTAEQERSDIQQAWRMFLCDSATPLGPQRAATDSIAPCPTD